MLTLLTVATQKSRYMPCFLESCARFGFDPVILGRGKRWTGFGMKLKLLERALSTMPRKRIVLFTDAHDSLILNSPEVILERYRKMNHPLIFSAEKSCWPDEWKAFIYPKADTPWQFLNSGGFIGEVCALWRHLRRLSRSAPGSLDDQRWWTNRFLADPELIRLDTRCEIFQTLWCSLDDLSLRRQVYNHVTRTCPSVVHANGWTDMSRIVKWFRASNYTRTSFTTSPCTSVNR